MTDFTLGDRGFLGKGDLLIALLAADGTFNGFGDPLNVTKFEIKTSGERKDRTSRRKLTDGQLVGTVSRIQPAEVTIESDSVEDRQLMGAIFMGRSSVFDSGQETISVPVVVDAIHDRWVKIGYRFVSSVVVQDETATTTYVLGTDYDLATEAGLIKTLASGAITDGETLHITLIAAGQSGFVLEGSTQSVVKARLLLDGVNLETGRNVFVDVDEVSVISDSVFDFMSDSHAVGKLSGSCRTLPGQNSPFRMTYTTPKEVS